MNLPVGVAYQKIVVDEQGEPIDFVYLEMNDLFARLVGIERDQAIGQRATSVIPRFRESLMDWVKLYGRVALLDEEVRTEFTSSYLGKTFQVTAFSHEPEHFTTIFTDISHLKEMEEQLRAAQVRLEGEVAVQAQRLDETQEELERETTRSEVADQQAKLFRTLLDQSGDAIFVLDMGTGRVLDANLRASAMLRLGRDELMEASFWEVMVEMADAAAWHRHVREVREGRRLFEGHLRNVAGDLTPVEVNARIVQGIGLDFMVSVVRNITGRRLRDEELQMILGTAMDGYLLVEANGLISQVNHAYCSLVGRSPETLIDTPVAELEAQPNSGSMQHHLAAISERGYDRFEARHRHLDGSVVPIEISARATGVGRTVRFHFFLRDRSLAERYQTEVAKLSEELGRLEKENLDV
jgi:PAS domain S-box-containing protein